MKFTRVKVRDLDVLWTNAVVECMDCPFHPNRTNGAFRCPRDDGGKTVGRLTCLSIGHREVGQPCGYFVKDTPENRAKLIVMRASE